MSVFLRRVLARQIAISDYVAEAIDGPSTVVYAGVPDRADTGLPREHTILVAQRLQPEKEAGVAVRAFAAAHVPGWRLQIAGEGAELRELQTLVRHLGITDSVEFLGQCEDVDSLMQRAGVLVAPCRVEGLGMAVLEAMSHGLPVVACGAGAHLETVGRASQPNIFPPGAWLQAAEHLTLMCGDQELREAYGAELQAIQRFSFSIAKQVADTDLIYRQILA